MVNKFKEVVEFFQKHPKYPFNKYYDDYDEYIAARLMILNTIKCYIPIDDLGAWRYVSAYTDFRRNEPNLRTSLLAAINENKEQVFFFALYDSRDDSDDFPAISVAATRDDFYGGKWEENVPQEEWFSIFQITLNLEKITAYDEVDQLLKNYFNKKLNFDELREIQARFEDPADE